MRPARTLLATLPATAAALLGACPAGTCPDPLEPAAAAPFCATDLNPRSPTAGTELCVPRDLPDGTALYFASVFCIHCTVNITALRHRMLELEAEGLHPHLVWVQLGAAAATPDGVADHFDATWDFPVLQDSPDACLWRTFHADWYELVILDRRDGPGVPRRFGPLAPATTAGEEGDRIVEAWREALTMDGAAGPVAAAP